MVGEGDKNDSSGLCCLIRLLPDTALRLTTRCLLCKSCKCRTLQENPNPKSEIPCGFRVAQICNLLYRRFAIGRAFNSSKTLVLATLCRMQFCDTADCKSALRQRRRFAMRTTNSLSEAAPFSETPATGGENRRPRRRP